MVEESQHNRIISPRPLTVPVLMSSLPLEDTCLDSPAPSSAPSSALGPGPLVWGAAAVAAALFL